MQTLSLLLAAFICAHTHTHASSNTCVHSASAPEPNAFTYNEVLLQWRLTANSAHYWSFPLHCSFPPLCWLSFSLCSLLMNSGSYAINSIWNTHTFHFHHYPSHTSLSVSPLFLPLSLSLSLSSAAITSGNFCAVHKEPEMWGVPWNSLKICQRRARERKGGPGLTVRWPSRRIFLSRRCQRAGSAHRCTQTI